MTFPRQDDGAARRGRADACEPDNFAAVIQFSAFLKTHGPRSLKDWMNYGIDASQSCEIPAVSFEERKTRADEIAIGSAVHLRGAMAITWQCARMPSCEQ